MNVVHNVFTYGTLMFPEVWSSVVAGDYQSRPATISGFERFAVLGEDFPAIIPASKNCMLEGVLYLGVSQQDVARLDIYESQIYDRQTVKLLEKGLVSGEGVNSAEVYVLNSGYSHILDNEPWDESEFLAKLARDF